MARALDSDPLQNFNFYLLDIPAPVIGLPLAFPFKLGAGASEGQLLSFKSISVPNLTVQTKTVTEGNWPFQHEIPIGRANVGDCTITSAVTSLSMDFYIWILQVVYGRQAPRRNFTVVQTQKDKTLPKRIYNLFGCFPKVWVPASSFDASSSEITIESLTLSVNEIEVLPGTPIT
ncbi:MAG: phage tail protein [Nitrospira sp.]